MVKHEKTFEFMFENALLYWLDMLPLECSAKMIELSKPIEFYWCYVLKVQFTDYETQTGNNFSNNDKIFSNQVYRKTKWKPKWSKRQEEYFITECFI